MCVCVCMCLYIYVALALGRVKVCGELVKAGNASPCFTEPLDWSIIILGTHPLLFSVSLCCVSSVSSPSLAPSFSPSLGYCSFNDLPCSELSA